MFLYEDMVGWSGERSPPPDDIYRNNKLNIPRIVKKGLSFFKCVSVAWLTLLVLTYWYLLESSDYHQKKRVSGKAWFGLGYTHTPVTDLEITRTTTDGNRVVCNWQSHFMFDVSSHLIFPPTCDGGETGVDVPTLHMKKEKTEQKGYLY